MDHAQVVLVTAMRGPKTQVLIAAETARMALRPGRDMRMMGMQGILNRPYAFTASFEPEAIFSAPYPAIAGHTMTPSIHVLWAAMWSGLAAQALAKARQFVAMQPANSDGCELMHAELSRLVNRHYVMNALVREAALEFDQAAVSNRSAADLVGTARVKRLKVVCSELLDEICRGALCLIGLPGYAEEGPYSLSEVIRDSLSARIMISNNRLLLANGRVERFVEESL
jgi:acyl-CoA dehydrogenase